MYRILWVSHTLVLLLFEQTIFGFSNIFRFVTWNEIHEPNACIIYRPIGAGNYIKMVHNGIEYGDMQLIGEVYDVLKQIVGLNNEEMATLFETWNKTELESYLIEITTKILNRKDDLTGDGYVVDYILDKTGMKGTGRWTVQEAAEHSVAAPLLAAALDSRYLAAFKDERVVASKLLQGPTESPPTVDKDQIISDLKAALYCAKVTSYAQGLGIIKAASNHHKWDVNLSLCATMWRGGCIIRAQLLNKIKTAYDGNPNLKNLLIDPTFAAELNERQMAWRRIVSLCVASGIAVPAFSAALSYYDQYRRERLPANLVQAQRDFFGGHTYERIDREGVFHCLWDDTHKDIGDLAGRTAGEL
jgi:6-phosphogluconate dehydrogenase